MGIAARVAAVLVGLFSGGVSAAPPALPELRDGDIVFHTSSSRQSDLVALVTGSRWTHMGIVFVEDGEPWVLEAVQPVKRTPLAAWVRRGKGEALAVKRLADGDGDGTFEEVALDSDCAPVLVGDLDGDGILDLVGATAGGVLGTVDVCFGISATEFADPVRVTVGNVSLQSIADVDGDGLADIFAVGTGSSRSYFVLNDGARGFSVRPAFWEPLGVAFQPALVDLTGDGLLDLAVATPGALQTLVQPCFVATSDGSDD